MIFYINIFIIIILLILFYMVIITILVTITIISIFTIIISVIFIIIFNISVPIYLSSKQSLATLFLFCPYKYNGRDSRRQESYYTSQKLFRQHQLPLTSWPATSLLTLWRKIRLKYSANSWVFPGFLRIRSANRWQSQKKTLAKGKFFHLNSFSTLITKPFFLSMSSAESYGSSMIPRSST